MIIINIYRKNMKIKLKVNSGTKIVDTLKNIDVSYGFTHWSPRYPEMIGMPDNSFPIKIVSVLNTVFNMNNKNTNEKQEEIVQHTAKVLNYIADLFPKSTLDNLHVQVNLNTKANKLFRNVSNYVNDNISTLSDNFSDKVDTEESRVYIEKKLIILGEKSLAQHPKLVEKHGLGTTAQYILCHEVGHCLERTNERKYPQEKDPLTLLLYKSSNIVFRQNGNKSGINKFIEDTNHSNEYAKIDELLWTNMNILHGEMYADLAGVIILRNLALQQKNYNIENFTSLVETVSQERLTGYQHHKYESEHLKGIMGFENLTREIECDRFDSFLPENMFNMVRNSKHLTSPALNSFTKEIASLKDKVLTEEEIHNLCCKHVNKGIAVTFNALITINPEIEKQIRTIDSTVFEGENRVGRLDTNKDRENVNCIMNYIDNNITPQLKEEIVKTKAIEGINNIKQSSTSENCLYILNMSNNPSEVRLKYQKEMSGSEEKESLPASKELPQSKVMALTKNDSVSRITQIRKKINDIIFPMVEIKIEPPKLKR